MADLPHRLATVKRDPDSQLEIRADGTARYEAFDQMLAVVKRSGVEQIAFRGNEAFAGDIDR